MAKIKGGHTTEIDRGYKAFKKQVDRIKHQPHVKVGVQADAGSYQDEGGQGPSLAEVATWNEFGTETIPERSFMRSSMDENSRALSDQTGKYLYQIGLDRMSVKQALDLLGLRIETLIKKKIRSNVPPPNAPSTIAKKGSTRTLIDTGQLLNSIRFVTMLRGEKGTKE